MCGRIQIGHRPIRLVRVELLPEDTRSSPSDSCPTTFSGTDPVREGRVESEPVVGKDHVVSELVLGEGGDFVGAVDPVGGFSSSAAVRGLMERMEKKERRRRRVKGMLVSKRLYQRWCRGETMM